MTKILLLSDTHSYIDDDVLKYVKQADEVWHAGDIGDLKVTDAIEALKPLRAVYGNIDDAQVRRVFPEHNRFMCEGVDVWITHIGGYPNRYNIRVKDEIKANPPKLFICGHSHILKVMPDKKLKLLHMNPGAIGKHGFHKVRTMLRFTIEGAEIKDLEVIEFEKIKTRSTTFGFFTRTNTTKI
ncbi:metallophosphoesterase family protein [Formosa algae]|uniref:metallophosphoesterase family protein n=1 Tax=Formosa algae TaxID=225843 RepID=UPI000CCDC996|nr:metallophosphoesterase family protein [Formosa algae]PNW27830.1 YfcE family phosphodiesterase [Formosa algae]